MPTLHRPASGSHASPLSVHLVLLPDRPELTTLTRPGSSGPKLQESVEATR